jgi:hypothetical protein
MCGLLSGLTLSHRGRGHYILNPFSIELIAKVSNGHPPQPLPSREGLIFQSSPLVGEGKGEGLMDFCKSLYIIIIPSFIPPPSMGGVGEGDSDLY